MSAMCDALGVSRGGYYDWLDRPAPAGRRRRRAALAQEVRAAHADSRGLYGSPRVTAELRARGVVVSEKTVAKVMRQQGLRAKTARRFKPKTTDSAHAWRPAGNVLGRDFAADRPDAKWCCDVTYVPTDEGYLYLAAVIDLCSRRIVGWSMAEHLRAGLCLGALEMAVLHRRPAPGLVHHSDRGVQYCCDDYQRRLADLGFVASMSGRGDCYDNAAIESWNGTYKRELVHQQPNGRFATREQARRMTFEYIEVFYNRQRRHSAIGYVSPEKFEAGLRN